MSSLPLFPTSLVGSYSQPDWLIDKEKLKGRFPPRTRAQELWRVSSEYLAEAQQDAVRLAVEDQLKAGLDIITDGEACRESYSNHFATALEGIDIDNPGEALDRSGEPVPVPRITGHHQAEASGERRRSSLPAKSHRSENQIYRAGAVHHEPAGPE